jgi:hypothetical protein
MFHADDPKKWVSFSLGISLLALGVIPFLSNFGFIAFGLPGFLESIIGKIALWVIAAVGIWLLIEGFMEEDTIRVITIITALLFLSIGVIQLLFNFSIISWGIPWLSLNVYYAIFTIEGILLIIATFMTW